jgi:hypothetical protein
MPLLNCPVPKLMLGADHRDTLKTRRNLAQWRGEAGDVASAVAEFEGLVGDPTRVLSADHPDTTKTLDQLQHCTGKSHDLD